MKISLPVATLEDAVALAAATAFYGGTLRGCATWDGLPLTRRADLLRDQLSHPPLGSRRPEGAATPVRAGASGTGDGLLVLAWSEDDLRRERLAGTRALRQLGVRPGTAVANTLEGALASPGSLLFGDVVEELGGLDVPLGTIDNEAGARAGWELVDRVQPALLVLEAGTGARFLAAAPPGERPWLAGALWLLRPGTAAPPEVAFRGWQRRWLAVPEAAAFAAVSCERGLLHADEALHVEVVGGELVVTPTTASTALLRYATGIGARLASCGCGLASAALEIGAS